MNELGYQCQNDPQFLGYCLHHFISTNIEKLKKEILK